VLPWIYVLFLSILLTHRAFRADRRCAAKYGSDWDTYRATVPYKIIPGIF
jgi:7-dehydrocholesterol reductase